MGRLSSLRPLTFSLLLLTGLGASAADVPGSADLQILERYPQAEIVDYRERHVDERIYPQDSLRRIGGNLRMAAQVVTAGDLTAITYLLPSTHSGIEAFTQGREALLERNAELLFWCEGRDCGSSSLWANSIFGKSMLYGPEAQQAYLLARLPDDADSLVALYGITRGNGRPYLHVERLAPDAPLGELLPTSATLLRQLRDSGELNLPRLGEPSPAWIDLLASVLRLDSSLRVSLAGGASEGWRDALVAERIRATRLELEPSQEDGLRIRLLR
ncbi:DUF4892 domain-containing protein [Stutzerimonas nosocomialis]|uniref:DUF4892 domain-containing protein n=1 Tax=Stutzerimonas nosocomialis TaxID=1056496 RepID=UPI0011099EF9|nr:DUF4892 domain-containing protein [Stutzerimonas nosocomialis]TLX60140.1 DUF4892 domain-containing protein [Stutzerimonas nosocomialis]